MKNKYLIIIFIVSILFSTNQLMSQWVPSLESFHGNICSFGKGGSFIYAGAAGGYIFSSSDDGNTWNLITSGEIENDVISIFGSDSQVFVGTNGGGMFYREITNGAWIELNNGLTDTTIFAILAEGQKNIITGTEHGIFVSPDNGASWISHTSEIGEKPVLSFTQNDSGIFAGTAEGSIYFSSDSGYSWTKRGGLENHKIVSLQVFGNKMFAGTSDSGVFASADNGLTWVESNDGLFNLNIVGLASNETRIFAATWSGARGAFVSADSGNSWTALNGLTDSLLTTILVKDQNIYVASSFSEVHSSTDNGENWSQVNIGGITSYNIVGFAKDGPNIFAGTWGGGVLKSTDFAKTWVPANYGLGDIFVRSIAMKDSILLVGSADPAIFRSTNYGGSWTIVDSELGHMGQGFLFQDSMIYAATGTDIYISADDGLNWKSMGLKEVANLGQSVNDVTAIKPYLFAGTGVAGVFRTSDYGESWIHPGQSFPVVTMTIIDTFLFAGTNYEIYRSSNYGKNWNSIAQTGYVSDLIPYEGYLFACTSQGLLFSTDKGDTWLDKSDGINGYVQSVLILDSTVLAGASSGVWARQLSEIVTNVQIDKDVAVDHFLLEQNYPNPFNPRTRIKYSIPQLSIITLKVFDIFGREIAILVNEEKPAGTYEVEFDARSYGGSNLSSGVYFYRMQAGDFIQTKKFVLIK